MRMKKPILYCSNCNMGFRYHTFKGKLSKNKDTREGIRTKREVARNLRKHYKGCIIRHVG